MSMTPTQHLERLYQATRHLQASAETHEALRASAEAVFRELSAPKPAPIPPEVPANG